MGSRRSADLQQKVSYLPDIHRFLPQAADAERGVICSFLLCPREIGLMCAERQISQAHFHLPTHQSIYATMLAMWSEERPIDFITLTQVFRDRSELDQVGGAGHITDLFTFLPTAANAGYYLDILQEKLFLREIIKICTEYAARSYDEQDQVPSIMAEVQEKIAGLGSHQAKKIPTMAENIMEATYALEGRMEGGANIIRTGLKALDEDCGPLERTNLFVIGGQTKSGKTVLAGQVALNLVLEQLPVLYISLEMTERELTLRLLSSIARVDTRSVKFWTEAEHGRFAAAAKVLATVPLTIITRTFKLSEIVAACQRAAARPGEPLAAIVLDYAQLTEGVKNGKDDRRQQEIAQISRTCKRLAGTHNVLFLLLTQLNDDGRTREARDIENDANLMVEVGHNRDTGERGVKVVLARSAPSGQRLKLRIIPEHTRVEDAPEMDVEPEQETGGKKKKPWYKK